MKTSKLIASLTVATALAATLAACSTDTPRTATGQTPAPTVVATQEATEPEVEETAVLAPADDVPAVGEGVAADQVEAIRAAGGNVYVSPLGDGSGIVVQPGQPLPAAVQAEVTSVTLTTPPTTMADLNPANLVEVNKAMADAGLAQFVLQYGGEFNNDGSLMKTMYSVVGVGIADDVRAELREAHTTSYTKADALAKFAPVQAAHPEIPLVDMAG